MQFFSRFAREHLYQILKFNYSLTPELYSRKFVIISEKVIEASFLYIKLTTPNPNFFGVIDLIYSYYMKFV